MCGSRVFRQDELDRIRYESLQVRDRLGSPIDRGVIDLVAVLRILGYDTIASCHGHFKRQPRSPYILMQPAGARTFADVAHRLDPSKRLYKQYAAQLSRGLRSAERHLTDIAALVDADVNVQILGPALLQLTPTSPHIAARPLLSWQRRSFARLASRLTELWLEGQLCRCYRSIHPSPPHWEHLMLSGWPGSEARG